MSGGATTTRRDRRPRWRLLFPAWTGVIIAVIAFGVLAQGLVQERLQDSARREVMTHTTYLAAELSEDPTAEQLRNFESRLRSIVSKSDAAAIAVYRNSDGGNQMRRVAVQSDSDTTLQLFPEQIPQPRSLVTTENPVLDGTPQLHLITALTTERGRTIGAVRMASTLGEAGALITLLHGLIILIGLGFLVATFLVANHFSHSVQRPIERLSSRLSELPCASSSDVSVFADETTQLSTLADKLAVLVSDFGGADAHRENIATLQARLEERTKLLQEAYLDMDSLDRVKDTFLSNLSHEMRTPLTSILAAEEILSNFGDEDPTTRKEFLEIIHQESTRLLDLIGKLLDLAKLEAKALQLNHSRVDLCDLVDGLATEAGASASLRDGNVQVSVDLPSTEVYCECDPERIARVVQSMLENAIRFSPAGGEVRVAIRCKPRQALVSVTDQAPVSDDRFTDMFESRSAYAGAGADPDDPRPFLGHPIAQKLAHMHGGTLEHGPSGDGGTVVVLQLPTEQTSSGEVFAANAP